MTLEPQANSKVTITPQYARYALAVLVVCYILNFVDRQILSILAEDVKRDLGLSDADLGFLYGTAFGVFFALFGIPLGRLADNMKRVQLITIGLSFWSLMTAFSGFSRNGAQLAVARFGVGIGEATASPCAYSLVSDYFPKERRATALAIYSSGLYLGSGLSLFVGGMIVKNWNQAYAAGGVPLGLAGWQAAYLAVGLPGLLLALVVMQLREPLRGISDGIVAPAATHPFRDFAEELMNVVPPFTLFGAYRRGAAGLAGNLVFAALVAIIAFAMIKVTGDKAQWIALAIGFYAVFSWATALRKRDAPTFALIWGTPATLCVILGYGLITMVAYSVSFWAAPYAIRVLGVSPAIAGLNLGGLGAAGGFIGVIAGGRVADHLRQKNPAGRVIVILAACVAPVIPFAIAFTTRNQSLYFALQFPIQILTSCALGTSIATVIDLVLPRMRGAVTATFLLGTTLIGLSIGPYTVGAISRATGSLSTGMLSILGVMPVALLLLIMAYRLVPAAEASKSARAKAAGEGGDQPSY